MDEGEIFIKNLVDAIRADNLNEAELSRKAGLNKRAVTDLREGRVKSPKISTAVKIAKALNRDPAEMMGLAPKHSVAPKVAEYLGRYDEVEQERLLDGILAVRSLHA